MNTAMSFINTVTLKNEANKVIRRVTRSRAPVIVTQRGKPAVAIIPVDDGALELSYAHRYQAAIQEGLADYRAGRHVPLGAFVKKHFPRHVERLSR
ncbi:MAG: type II toxin-antitoxin system prevent-host-death family antitoxin [Candidatus Coatesbacteria bacterium]